MRIQSSSLEIKNSQFVNFEPSGSVASYLFQIWAESTLTVDNITFNTVNVQMFEIINSKADLVAVSVSSTIQREGYMLYSEHSKITITSMTL